MSDPIQNNELLFYKPRLVTDDNTNGGRISGNEIITNTLQNTFGHAFSADREAGLTSYRWVYMLVSNANKKSLMASLFRFFEPTAGDDFCCFFDGDGIDTQADIVGTERKFSVGTLNTAVTAGGSTLLVDLQDISHASGNDKVLDVGDDVMISSKATFDAVSGTIEQKAIGSITSIVDTLATVVLSTALANDYAAWDNDLRTGTKIMFCKNFGDITTSFDSWVETFSTDGAYDEATYQPILDNQGTMDMEITHSFTDDAGNFTATSDDPDLSDLGSGSTGVDFSPINTILPGGHPLYTLEAAGWSGSPKTGDTLVFKIKGSYVKVIEKRVIPPLCGPLTGNKLTLVVGGESA